MASKSSASTLTKTSKSTEKKVEKNKKLKTKTEKGAEPAPPRRKGIHRRAKKPMMTRDLKGKSLPGKCDTWPLIFWWEAHWELFHGTVCLVGLSIASMLITFFKTPDYLPKPSMRVEMLLLTVLILHVHIWCIARFFLLRKNKMKDFKIFLWITIGLAVGVGVVLPVISVLLNHYSLLMFAYCACAAGAFLEMAYTMYRITFRGNKGKLSLKLRGYMLELKKEKNYKDQIEKLKIPVKDVEKLEKNPNNTTTSQAKTADSKVSDIKSTITS